MENEQGSNHSMNRAMSALRPTCAIDQTQVPARLAWAHQYFYSLSQVQHQSLRQHPRRSRNRCPRAQKSAKFRPKVHAHRAVPPWQRHLLFRTRGVAGISYSSSRIITYGGVSCFDDPTRNLATQESRSPGVLCSRSFDRRQKKVKQPPAMAPQPQPVRSGSSYTTRFRVDSPQSRFADQSSKRTGLHLGKRQESILYNQCPLCACRPLSYQRIYANFTIVA